MNCLLDTHAILWFFNGDGLSLSDTAREIILDLQHKKFVSIASIWEVAIKIRIGKLHFPQNTEGFTDQIRTNGFTLLPISTEYIIMTEQLPLIHRDPFDRLLTASAMVENMSIISCDSNIKRYPVNSIW